MKYRLADQGTILRWVAFGFAISLLLAIEAGYFLVDASTIKKTLSFSWLIVAVLFLATVGFHGLASLCTVIFSKQNDRIWYLPAFVLPPCIVLLGVNGIIWTEIDDEGAQQIVCGLHLLQHDPDIGIYKAAYFVGYVSRQYLLACLPTYFFGPGLLALRLGNVYIYFISYWAFLGALAEYLRSKGNSRPVLFASFTGCLISLSAYPVMVVRLFEQTTMPISATLLFIAGLLYFLARPTLYRVFWITWSVGYFADGYTPALASWFLAMSVLIYLVAHPKYRCFILIVSILHGLLAAIVGSLIIQDAQAWSNKLAFTYSRIGGNQTCWRYFSGFHFALSQEGSLLSCPLALGILVALYFSLRFKDYRFALVCLWSLAVIAASLTFVGSFVNVPQFELHRAIIILPVLATGMVVFYNHYATRLHLSEFHQSAFTVCARGSILYMVCTSLPLPLTMRTFIYNKEISDYDMALYQIDSLNTNSHGTALHKLYIVPPLIFENFQRGLTYFAPDAVIIQGAPPPGEKKPGTYLLSYKPVDEAGGLDDKGRRVVQLKPE